MHLRSLHQQTGLSCREQHRRRPGTYTLSGSQAVRWRHRQGALSHGRSVVPRSGKREDSCATPWIELGSALDVRGVLDGRVGSHYHGREEIWHGHILSLSSLEAVQENVSILTPQQVFQLLALAADTLVKI